MSTALAMRPTGAAVGIRLDTIAIQIAPNRKATYISPPTATPEAIVLGLQDVGFLLSLVAATSTGEDIVNGLGSLVSGLTILSTPEAIVLALIAAGLMEAS